jgi:hypothetical protein
MVMMANLVIFWCALILENVVSLYIPIRYRPMNLLYCREKYRDDEIETKQAKLPIVEVYYNNEMTSEFVFGNDLKPTIEKFTFFVEELKAKYPQSKESKFIQNVYSDGQLKDIITSSDENNINIVKYFRMGCKKCMNFAPVYEKLALENSASSWNWYDVDISMVPEYLKELRQRLLGQSPTKENVISNCDMCSNTGFVPCKECNGSGKISRGQYVVICPTCVGYTKLRCDKCGGKCLKC